MQLKFLKSESRKKVNDVNHPEACFEETFSSSIRLVKNQWNKIYLLLSLIVFDVQQPSVEHITISRNNNNN